MKRSLPHNEATRLAAVRRCTELDATSTPLFGDLTTLAAQICETPMAWVSFVEAERVRLISRFGWEGETFPREGSFCAHAVLEDDLFVVPDARADPRFEEASMPSVLVGVRFYAGAPLVTPDGHAIGTLAVLDRRPRQLRDHQAEVLRLLAHQIVTQVHLNRRLREQALAISHRGKTLEELERLFTLSLDLLCIADLKGYFQRLNPAWQRTLGYTVEELKRKPYIAFVHPADRAKTIAEAEKLSRGIDAISFENRYRCKDGSYKWLLWNSTTSKASATIYAVARDITDRKRAEEELRHYARELEVAKQRAEEATGAKSEFLAKMSHEIRTPMNAIIGMTDLALDTDLTDDQRECLRTVKTSAGGLLKLLDDILDLSRIEARKLELDAAPFALRDTVEDAAKVLALRAYEKGLEFACHVLPEVPDALIGDATRLRQVIVNLLSNAIKFTHQGEVLLRVREKSRFGTSTTLEFAVTDTGIGIPPDKRRTIFDAFTQADRSTPREYGGTGLGLAICAQLVEMMGGHISVESELGRGSTFHFTAHFALQPGVDFALRTSAMEGLEGLRVLIVDPSSTWRSILMDVLGQWRLESTAVESGRAALAAVEKSASQGRPFTAAVLSAELPRLGRAELVERVREASCHPDPRIVLLTVPGRKKKSRIPGAVRVVTKPVKQSDLLAALTNHEPAELSTPSLAVGKTPRPLRILLAEDTMASQHVTARILEKRGHEVVAVNNGRELLDRLESCPPATFDVVVLDVEMPEMNGWEASEAIRQGEARHERRVPIIALTGHARQECIGPARRGDVDAILSKPVNAERMVQTVESMASQGGSQLEAIDRAELLHRLGGDTQLFQEMVDIFLADRPKLMSRLKTAVEQRNPDQLAAAAHALKGAVSNFGAAPASEAARKLEAMGRSRDLEDVEDTLETLEREIARLEQALQAGDLHDSKGSTPSVTPGDRGIGGSG